MIIFCIKKKLGLLILPGTDKFIRIPTDQDPHHKKKIQTLSKQQSKDFYFIMFQSHC